VTFPRPLRWLAAVLAGLAIFVAVLIALLDWNQLRGPIEREVTRATGRSFAINGDLTVELSLHPRIVANDVFMGNAPWSHEPAMAEVKAVAFRIDLLELLAGKLVLPELTLSQPRLALEVNRSGETNWDFAGADKDKPVRIPAVDLLTVDDGNVSYRDARDGTDMALEVKTLAANAAAPQYGLELQGKGRYKGQAATLHARGGALLHLRNAADPYPIKVSGEVGTTRFAIDGM